MTLCYASGSPASSRCVLLFFHPACFRRHGPLCDGFSDRANGTLSITACRQRERVLTRGEAYVLVVPYEKVVPHAKQEEMRRQNREKNAAKWLETILCQDHSQSRRSELN